MRASLLLSAIVVLSAAYACGDAYDEEPPPPASGGVDASVDGETASPDASAPDAAVATPPPRRPTICPFVECPPGDAVECEDDPCTASAPRDFDPIGDAKIDQDRCAASAVGPGTSAFFNERARGFDRSHVTLAFRLVSVTTADRVIASVTSEGESWELYARDGMLVLCELNTSGEACAAPLPAPPSGSMIHLYGIAVATAPENAAFALSINDTCAPERVLPVTGTSSGKDVRGSIGCLGGSVPCSVVFDDAVLAVTPE